MSKTLYRSDKNRMVAGVIGGIAEITNMDATILRLIYVAACIFTAGAPLVLLYIVAAIIIPKRGIS
ncbi:PspC domain-containing protein [Gracilibacillus sp. YIM 98692]|uniref:PspC domain-containing protein n=1 Tax=Gracilibacillus sp. YIM 98692 TaxID=2663532 RepID=UPI0013D32077|nr:PspC domain-containing protein [Gracilibacillus sp. YIM 98692]